MSATSGNPNSNAREISPRNIDLVAQDISRINDPAVLASVIEKNQVTLKEGWAELDRLTARLEALNAREKSIILQTSQVVVKPTAAVSPSV